MCVCVCVCVCVCLCVCTNVVLAHDNINSITKPRDAKSMLCLFSFFFFLFKMNLFLQEK